jgi:Bacterial Ig-like domain (group 1)/Subtilase family
MDPRSDPLCRLRRRISIVVFVLALAGSGLARPALAASLGGNALQPTALGQIAALLAEKDARTPAEQKVDSNLLYAFKRATGAKLSAAAATLRTGVAISARGTTVVDITSRVSDALLQRIAALGGKIIAAYPQYRSVRAVVPIGQVLTIAGWDAVIFIQPEQQAMTAGSSAAAPGRTPPAAAGALPDARPPRRPSFATSPPSAPPAAATQGITITNPVNRSGGDVAHRADQARRLYGYTGEGEKVCVLSNGVDSLAALQASGDLPPVTVVPNAAGSGDEGSAMLEIVHDLAPGAQLAYATAFTSIASFAANIKTLRNTYGCTVLVDDVSYFAESPFQLGQAPGVVSNTNGGIVTQAVNEVVASGALYFSSAGNSGNRNDGTSGVWEGDFVAGGPVAAPISGIGQLHNFDPGVSNQLFDTVTQGSSGPVTLFWADPLGGSSNDYDLFLLSSTGTAVVNASTNVQNGTRDPYEQTSIAPATGQRIVVVQRPGAAGRYLHVNTNRGQLQFATAGQTGGHASALGGFGVAAANAHNPAVVFSGSTVVETFSSDGPRRHFFSPDGTPITPGNFSSTGGAVAQKPDLTAADGVSCQAPGFNPFFGTSAAAPHAAAIAALLRSADPSLTNAQMHTILTSAPAAIDIEAPGTDRDSGAGVLNALAAVQALDAPAVPLLSLGQVRASEGPLSNSNGVIESGESFKLTVPLTNTTLVTATNVQVALELLGPAPGAQVLTPGPLSYGTLAASGGFAGAAQPFVVSLAPTAPCGMTLSFKITATYEGGGSNSPQVFFASVATGAPLTLDTTLDTTAPPASAGPPAYSAATGLQTGRLSRSGAPSNCATSSPNPGLISAFGARRYDAYTFTNTSASPACVTVTLITPQNGNASALFAAAYGAGGFAPAAPNQNYLGDPGTSPDTLTPVTFSFLAPASQPVTIVVHEIDPGAGAGVGLGAYTLKISGAGFGICAAPPPQPASITATAGGGQSAYTGAAFGTQLQAIVRDASGDPVPGVGVAFSAPASGPGTTFPDGNLAVTDISGHASVAISANARVGSYTVTANTSNPALTVSASFTLTNTGVLYLPIVVQ